MKNNRNTQSGTVYIEHLLELENKRRETFEGIALAIAKDHRRAAELIKAAIDLLLICNEGPYVKNAMTETVFYDEAYCDGICLMNDLLSFAMGIEESRRVSMNYIIERPPVYRDDVCPECKKKVRYIINAFHEKYICPKCKAGRPVDEF